MLKRLTFFMLLTMTFAVYGQEIIRPAPELLFRATGAANPTFIKISDANFEMADQDDYIGVYSNDMYCYGSQSLTNIPTFVTAFGNDFTEAGKQGFDPNDDINLFFWDSQTDKYYDIEAGEVLSAITNQPAKLIWQPLNLLFAKNLSITGEITLNADPVLSEVKIEITGPDEWKTGDGGLIYLKMTTQNIVGETMVKSAGAGEFTAGRWFHDGHWYDYTYQVSPEDHNLKFTGFGTDVFTGDMVSSDKTIAVITDVENNDNIFYQNDYIIFYTQDGFVYAKNLIGKVAISIRRDSPFGSYARQVDGESRITSVQKFQGGEWYFKYILEMTDRGWKKLDQFTGVKFKLQ